VVPCLQEDDLQLRAIGELYDLVRTDKAHVEDALSMGLPITILPLLLSEKFVSASPPSLSLFSWSPPPARD
jgi:hypothetical protein